MPTFIAEVRDAKGNMKTEKIDAQTVDSARKKLKTNAPNIYKSKDFTDKYGEDGINQILKYDYFSFQELFRRFLKLRG